MEEKAVRGVAWTVMSFGANRAITLISTVVLARLLVPEDFGVIALATLTMSIASIFAALGLGSTLILRQEWDRRAQGTVLSLMVASGVVLAALVALTAPVVATLLDESRVTDVLRVMSLALLVNSWGTFYAVLNQRDLEFRKNFVAQVCQSVVYAIVAITAAVLGAGVWAIVAGQLVQALTFSVVLLVLASDRIRPTFVPAAARTAIRTGRAYLVQGALAYVQQNADYLIVGRALGSGALGFYSMAYRLAELPLWAVGDPVAKVTFPSFARMRQRGEDVLPTFLSTFQLLGAIVLPIGAILSATAEPLTATVFGDKWLPMATPLAVFGIWAAVRPLQNYTAWLFNSYDKAGFTARVSAIVLVALIPALIVAAQYSIVWVAVVMLFHATATITIQTVLARRLIGLTLRRQLVALRPIALGFAGAWAAARGVVDLTEPLPAPAQLGTGIAAGAAAYILVLWLADRSLPRQAVRQLLRVLGRPPQPVGA
ncbi:MAG: lipopolysaccharide biosynthesis protein [Solirubrobacteraceae bacterium]